MSDAPSGRLVRPRHRAPTVTERARLRVTAALPSVRPLSRPALAAVAVTGIVVSGSAAASLAMADDSSSAATTSASDTPAGEGTDLTSGSASDSTLLDERGAEGEEFGVSRSGARPQLADEDEGEVSLDRQGAEAGVSGAATVEAPSDPRDIALAMLGDYGWPSSEFDCLDSLWVGESNWDHTATNPTSGAYGIPQSLPAEKMAAAGSDWRTNPATQIEWGLSYIEDRYGSPCAANSFKMSNGWY